MAGYAEVERAQRLIGGIGVDQEVRRKRIDWTGYNAAHISSAFIAC
jgi:hypothetical protein